MSIRGKQLWLSLWQRIIAQGDPDKVYNDLVVRYSEPHRVYHTLEHIKYCLNELEQARHLAVNLNAVEWALWYHDAIYDTRAKDNEDRSAKFAMKVAKDALLPDNFGQSAANLIMATKHSGTPTDSDAKLLVDIDLSILGQPEEKFDEYERQIREEYKWASENTFIAERSAVLRLFLGRQVIYSTRFFRDKYETRSRQNIVRSLKKLSNFTI